MFFPIIFEASNLPHVLKIYSGDMNHLVTKLPQVYLVDFEHPVLCYSPLKNMRYKKVLELNRHQPSIVMHRRLLIYLY